MNIRTEFGKDGKPTFILVSTPELKLPSLGFSRIEDAELAVAIAKAMQVRGIDYWSELHHVIKPVFRVLNLSDSGWV